MNSNKSPKKLLPGGTSSDVESWVGLSPVATAEEQFSEQASEVAPGKGLTNLRPNHFSDYIGQESVKENLKIACQAAKGRGEPLDHLLFHGPPGLGKTSLAKIIAREMGVGFKSTSGPVIERPGDLAAILTALEGHDVLFIDEIHRLPRIVEEVLYPAMEDQEIDILIGSGQAAKSVKIELKPFTLIGATTRTGLLTSPLRDRFGVVTRLGFYTAEQLALIVIRSAGLLSVPIDTDAASEIGRRARGTPRIANRLLRRLRDFATERADGRITSDVVQHGLAMLQVDARGLDEMDRAIMETIIDRFDGGPVGIEAIAASIGEEAETLEEVYEPYLVQAGLIARTRRGRAATDLSYQHLGRPVVQQRLGIFND